MKVADLKPSKYLKAKVEVPEEGSVTVTINGFYQETGEGDDGSEYKLNLLHFKEFDKALKLNSGMIDVLAALYGGDTDGWNGKRVVLFSTVQAYNGKDYDVIRIRNRNPDAAASASK